MAKKQVEISGIGKVQLAKRRGNTNIRLSYARDGSIRVSLPYFVPYKTAIDFVKSKENWLKKHKPNPISVIEDGDRLGKYHRFEFITSLSASRPQTRVTERKIRVTLPNGMELDDQQAVNAAGRGAHKALKIEADNLLPPRLKQLAAKFDFDYKSVSTKKLISRWGSCSQHKDIVLNIYLVQLPWELIDYVILHELVHTEHLNHSDEFWSRFDQILPGAKKYRKELKKYKTAVMTAKN